MIVYNAQRAALIPAETAQMGDLQSSIQAINWRPILLTIGALLAGYIIYRAVTKRKGRRSAFQELKRKQRAQQKALIYRQELAKAEREAA